MLRKRRSVGEKKGVQMIPRRQPALRDYGHQIGKGEKWYVGGKKGNQVNWFLMG